MDDSAPVAVIDLGTNTFHLLVVQPTSDGHFVELHRERRFIKLAEDGIEAIGPAPFARGLEALAAYAELLQRLGVQQVRALGTAALRTARNGNDFVRAAREQTGIHTELIDGLEEARLINLGVQLAVPPSATNRLIMDIGGGSVEFILSNGPTVIWADSFPIGVSVLYRRFHHSEPISTTEIGVLQQFLREQLTPLRVQLAAHPTAQLVGAAGTFDVIANVLKIGQPTPHCSQIDLSRLDGLYQRLVTATRAERYAMPEVPEDRAEMIVVAVILVRYVLGLLHRPELLVSAYSMKEGALVEMLGQSSSSSTS